MAIFNPPGYHSEDGMSGGSVEGLQHGDFVVMKQTLYNTDNTEEVYVDGALVCENGSWYFCHNDDRFNGANPMDTLGYKFGWYFSDLSYYIERGIVMGRNSMPPAHTHGYPENKVELKEEYKDKKDKKEIDSIVGHFLNRSLIK